MAYIIQLLTQNHLHMKYSPRNLKLHHVVAFIRITLSGNFLLLFEYGILACFYTSLNLLDFHVTVIL